MSVEEAVYGLDVTARDNFGVLVGESNSGTINSVTHYHQAPPSPIREAARPRILPLRSVNPLFLGRATELAKIESVLPIEDGCENEPPSETKTLVVQGLGGSGKSELTLRYLKMHDQSYWAMFWIDGSSEKSLMTGYEQIAKQLGLGSAHVANTRHHLSGRQQPWLLVIDNADDPELDLAPYLPDQRGHVIITTRNPELDVFGSESVLRLEGLADQDALALFYKAAGLPVQQHEASRERATDILKVLDYHTLAIIQAGAYIRKTRDLDGYVKFFHEQRRLVLEYCAPQAKAQYGSVYATFEISASRLQHESLNRQQSATDALELLNLFAFMDTRGSFETILRDANDFALSPSCPHGSPCDTCTFNSNEAQEDTMIIIEDVPLLAQRHSNLLPSASYASGDSLGKHRWREACGKLHQYSMVGFENADGEDVLTFHPLVLMWALARQSKESQWQSWRAVATTMFLAGQGDVTDSFGPRRDRLSAQVRACADHVAEEWWTGPRNLDYLFLLYHLGWFLMWSRNDSQNAKICRCLERGLEAVEASQATMATDARQELESRMGWEALCAGDLNKSTQLSVRVVEARRARLSETDAKLLNAEYQLALTYRLDGQLKRAITIIEHVVDVRKRVSPDTDRNYLNSRIELAEALRQDAQTLRAIEILEQIMDIRQHTLDERHPDRITSNHALAMAYLDNGQFNDAISLFEKALQTMALTFPENDSSRLDLTHSLATAYIRVKRVPEAIILLEHVVKIEQQTLAEVHPNRLASMDLLGVAYYESGRYSEAVQLLAHVVHVRDTTLAEADVRRTIAERQLARAFKSNGQPQEALRTMRHVLELERLALPEDDPERLEDEELLRTWTQRSC